MEKVKTIEEDLEAVLNFWLGPLEERARLNLDRMGTWFQKSSSFDAEIKKRFEGLLNKVSSCPPDTLVGRAPRHQLAIIILLDQFSRNIYRDTPRAFAHDPLALSLAQDVVARGEDKTLHLMERLLIILPFVHSEEMEQQQRSAALAQALIGELPPDQRPPLERFMFFNRRHIEVISQFGRFPHRNEILGRSSTNEEKDYLAQHGREF